MTSIDCRRVVLVILDGLRPDAIDELQLLNLLTLELQGASTRCACTVSPSVTAAAMGSLLTGVQPADHGLTSDRFHIPRSRSGVVPLPTVLRDAGFITSAFLAEPPILYRRLGKALGQRLGIVRPVFSGQCASEIVTASLPALERQCTGLIMLHLPDADRAGHRSGWMSDEYCAAAERLDVAVGRVAEVALADPHTMLMLCADHGGGGVVYNDHEGDHPLDYTIPIIVAGPGVTEHSELHEASILDIPVTIAAALGVEVPETYIGRRLLEHLAQEVVAA